MNVYGAFSLPSPPRCVDLSLFQPHMMKGVVTIIIVTDTKTRLMKHAISVKPGFKNVSKGFQTPETGLQRVSKGFRKGFQTPETGFAKRFQ